MSETYLYIIHFTVVSELLFTIETCMDHLQDYAIKYK